MEQLLAELINYDSAEISDALDSLGIEGALAGIKPLTVGIKVCGRAFTVKYAKYSEKPTDFKCAADYIDDVPKGAVIVIDNNGSDNTTTWGDILTQMAIIKQINGTIINGSVRDVDYIVENKYALFTKHCYMRSGKNRVYLQKTQCDLVINHVVIKPGDIIFGDTNGVLVIPWKYAQEVLARANNIKLTEEKIKQSINHGMKLADARKLFRYDQPWLPN